MAVSNSRICARPCYDRRSRPWRGSWSLVEWRCEMPETPNQLIFWEQSDDIAMGHSTAAHVCAAAIARHGSQEISFSHRRGWWPCSAGCAGRVTGSCRMGWVAVGGWPRPELWLPWIGTAPRLGACRASVTSVGSKLTGSRGVRSVSFRWPCPASAMAKAAPWTGWVAASSSGVDQLPSHRKPSRLAISVLIAARCADRLFLDVYGPTRRRSLRRRERISAQGHGMSWLPRRWWEWDQALRY